MMNLFLNKINLFVRCEVESMDMGYIKYFE